MELKPTNIVRYTTRRLPVDNNRVIAYDLRPDWHNLDVCAYKSQGYTYITYSSG